MEKSKRKEFLDFLYKRFTELDLKIEQIQKSVNNLKGNIDYIKSEVDDIKLFIGWEEGLKDFKIDKISLLVKIKSNITRINYNENELEDLSSRVDDLD